MRLALWCALLGGGALQPSFGADATPATPALNSRVDETVNAILARTGLPSVSIALVRNSGIVYVHAYGLAQLTPQRAATPAMRYAVGSISKEFTATALLLLQESGKVSIDDRAGKWIPGMGAAANVSISSLLSHTSGIRDYWPQDYDPPEMLQPIKPQEIVARWAAQPLDFATGTAWQYSNTGYTIAGIIAERAAGKSLFQFLQERIFEPLRMTSVVDFDARPLPAGDAIGYMRYALGPLRPAAKEGHGWLFAAGELAMTATDLARWDVALLERKLLDEASYRELTTEVRLANGAGTGYGLGLDVELKSGTRILKHSGEVGGFTAENRIYPDDGIAIVVLTNQDATDASGTIADALADLLLVADSPSQAAAVAAAKDIFKQLQNGKIDRQRLTTNASSYFTSQALEDYRASLSPLGEPTSFVLKRSVQRGGFATHVYEAAFSHQTLNIVVRSTVDGKIEQYTVSSK
jgi:D-alanyl-D-alanine carboxypeptidase